MEGEIERGSEEKRETDRWTVRRLNAERVIEREEMSERD